MIPWSKGTDSEDVNTIIFDENYKNITFPFGPELYFNELFSVQTYHLEDEFIYEHRIDSCGNKTLILKKFKGNWGNEGIIQKIISFEIKYK